MTTTTGAAFSRRPLRPAEESPTLESILAHTTKKSQPIHGIFALEYRQWLNEVAYDTIWG